MAVAKVIGKIGDVFSIRLKNESKCYGQIIIEKNNSIAIVVLKKLYGVQETPSLSEVLNDEPLFFVNTLDGKIYNGHWEIIGNDIANIKNYKLPYYKLGTKDDARLIDFNDNELRKISPQEFDQLIYKPIASPASFEDTVNGYHKFDTWYESDKKYFYDYVINSQKFRN